MDKILKCLNCGGEIKYIDEVSGSFVHNIVDGEIDWVDKEIYGDSWNYLECVKCQTQYGYDVDENDKVILIP